MKAYKGTWDLQSLGDFSYEVGKTYTFSGKLEMCISGFHFCENPDDVLQYFSILYKNNRNFVLLEINVPDDNIIIKNENNPFYNKGVTNKIEILRIIPPTEYDNLFRRTMFNENKESTQQIYFYNNINYRIVMVNFTYDNKGKMVNCKQFSYPYTEKMDKTWNLNYNINYYYDEYEQLLKTVNQKNEEIECSYEYSENKLIKMFDEKRKLHLTFDYDNMGKIIKSYKDGIEKNYNYNPDNTIHIINITKFNTKYLKTFIYNNEGKISKIVETLNGDTCSVIEIS